MTSEDQWANTTIRGLSALRIAVIQCIWEALEQIAGLYAYYLGAPITWSSLQVNESCRRLAVLTVSEQDTVRTASRRQLSLTCREVGCSRGTLWSGIESSDLLQCLPNALDDRDQESRESANCGIRPLIFRRHRQEAARP